MSQTFHALVSVSGLRVLTVVEDNRSYTATDESHTNIDEIIEALGLGEPVAHLFEEGRIIEQKFADVVEGRVAVRGGNVYFDEEVVSGPVVDTILAFIKKDLPIYPLVRFMENLAANPQQHSRDMLYNFIKNNEISIDEEGMLVAHKFVQKDYTSFAEGTAFVDGVEHTGHIPNHLGAIVTMPRSDVEHDPSVHCHVGLHVGGLSYVRQYNSWNGNGRLLLVRFDPRDVVSVPNDYNHGKIRVCRYEVIDETDFDTAQELYYEDRGTFVDEDADAVKEKPLSLAGW